MSSFLGPPRAPRLDGLWLALLFLGLYEALRQHTIPGDGTQLLDLAQRDSVTHNVHFLYLPLLGWLRQLFEGSSVFQIASHLSCVAGALAVGMTHVGFRVLRVSRAEAALATMLVGTAPAMVFYSTAVELHLPFLAVSSIAFAAAAHLGARPTFSRAALLGLATGASYSAHATGAFLPMPLLFVAWTLGTRYGVDRAPAARGGWAGLALVVAALHCATMWGLPAVLRQIEDAYLVRPDAARNWIANNYVPWNSAADIGVTAWNEWLLTFAPISVLWIRGFAWPETRRMAAGLALSLLPYLGMSFLLLARHSERGAYQLPLMWLAAWLVVRTWKASHVALIAIAGIGLSFALLKVPEIRDWDSTWKWETKPHDDLEFGPTFASGVEAIVDDEDLVLLTGGFADVAACLVFLPDATFLRLEQLPAAGEAELRALLPLFDQYATQWLAEGKRILITETVQRAAHPGVFAGSELLETVLLTHFRTNYQLTPITSGAFTGMELTAK